MYLNGQKSLGENIYWKDAFYYKTHEILKWSPKLPGGWALKTAC